MLAVKIPVARLKPGMYVIDPGISWVHSPFLYTREGFIVDQAQVDHILAQGFIEALYDPTQPPPPVTATVKAGLSPVEIQAAQKTYASAYTQIKKCMDSSAGGCPAVTAAEPCVRAVILDLKRNANALLTLATLKGRDEYTYRHSVNVAVFAVAFAQHLGLTDEQQHLAGLAGLFHDYGKTLVPREILNAPRSLTPAEATIMRSHVLLGYEALRQVRDIPREILKGVVQHHEMHNGAGYPYGLAGMQIGLFGRMLSICDIYDALSSKRVYKEAVSPNHALGTIYKLSGTSWPSGFADAFIKMVGIFPLGTGVRLSDGRSAIVSHCDPSFPTLPDVITAERDCGGAFRLDEHLSLRLQKKISVSRTLTQEETEQMNIPRLLGISD